MSRFTNLEFGGQSENRQQSRSVAKDAQFYLSQAALAFSQGQFEQALRSYSKVLEFDPACAPAWTGQVRMLIELGEFREAKVWADKALEKFPEEAELLAAKAVALARTGDVRGGLAFSDAAIAARGDTPYVWLARGDVFLARSEKRADFCFEKALGLAPGDWLLRWLASRICYFYKQFSRAIKLAQEALGFDAAQPAGWLQLGRCQLALGLLGPARDSFQHARQLDPTCRPDEEEMTELAEGSLGTRLTGWCRKLFGR